MAQRPQFGDRPFNSGTLTQHTFKRYASMVDLNADTANTGFGYVVGQGVLYYNASGTWVSVAQGTTIPLPGGGTTGQVLAKVSNIDFDYGWVSLVDVDVVTRTQSILDALVFG